MTQFSKTVLETQETKEESAASGLTKVADGVFRTKIIFVGAYFGDSPDGWVLIDTGLPMSDGKIRRAAENHYGANSKPSAIILTHGHFDHAGAALALAEQWNISIYAHRLEMPYLTGKSDYPPQDPTMGGAIAQMARDSRARRSGSNRATPDNQPATFRRTRRASRPCLLPAQSS